MEHSNPILMGNDSPQKFITIGEVMLRLTPPNYEKIRMASSFEASYGGSEANIALALANLGVDSTFFSVVPNNSLGKSAVRWLRCNDVHCTPMILSTKEETPSHRLGTYYLDNMYTMSLTAYMQPVFLYCIDWKDNVLLILSCFLCILLFGLFFYVRIQLHKKEKATDVSEKNIYLIGESSFDAINHTLTNKEEVKFCPPQAAKLLLAFIATSDYFLTYDEIAVVCCWTLSDTGLKERRRKAINSLRKLFETDKSVKILAVSEKQGYQIVISK